MAVWLIGVHGAEPWYHQLATYVMFLSFVVGILFLALYYQYFHVKRLSYATNNNPPANMPYSYVTPNGTFVVSDHVGDHHSNGMLTTGKNPFTSSTSAVSVSSKLSDPYNPVLGKIFLHIALRLSLGLPCNTRPLIGYHPTDNQ